MGSSRSGKTPAPHRGVMPVRIRPGPPSSRAFREGPGLQRREAESDSPAALQCPRGPVEKARGSGPRDPGSIPGGGPAATPGAPRGPYPRRRGFDSLRSDRDVAQRKGTCLGRRGRRPPAVDPAHPDHFRGRAQGEQPVCQAGQDGFDPRRPLHAVVAQSAEAPGPDPGGWGFDSLRRHNGSEAVAAGRSPKPPPTGFDSRLARREMEGAFAVVRCRSRKPVVRKHGGSTPPPSAIVRDRVP
jgi:hypothetical protein